MCNFLFVVKLGLQTPSLCNCMSKAKDDYSGAASRNNNYLKLKTFIKNLTLIQFLHDVEDISLIHLLQLAGLLVGLLTVDV